MLELVGMSDRGESIDFDAERLGLSAALDQQRALARDSTEPVTARFVVVVERLSAVLDALEQGDSDGATVAVLHAMRAASE